MEYSILWRRVGLTSSCTLLELRRRKIDGVTVPINVMGPKQQEAQQPIYDMNHF